MLYELGKGTYGVVYPAQNALRNINSAMKVYLYKEDRQIKYCRELNIL